MMGWGAALLLLLLLPGAAGGRQALSLDGRWQFRLDPNDTALASRWYAAELPPHTAAAFRPIAVPGTWGAQGFGEPWRCSMTPHKPMPYCDGGNSVKHHHYGAAIYRLQLPSNASSPPMHPHQRLFVVFDGVMRAVRL